LDARAGIRAGAAVFAVAFLSIAEHAFGPAQLFAILSVYTVA
jgi:hypothetical protein